MKSEYTAIKKATGCDVRLPGAVGRKRNQNRVALVIAKYNFVFPLRGRRSKQGTGGSSHQIRENHTRFLVEKLKSAA